MVGDSRSGIPYSIWRAYRATGGRPSTRGGTQTYRAFQWVERVDHHDETRHLLEHVTHALDPESGRMHLCRLSTTGSESDLTE